MSNRVDHHEIDIFKPFMAMLTQTIILKKKISPMGCSFEINFENGHPLMLVNGKWRSLSGRKKGYDLSGKHLFEIYKEHFHLHPTYIVKDGQANRIMEIKSSIQIHGFKATATLMYHNGQSDTLVMKGNWIDTYADIVDPISNAPIARFSRILSSRGEVFGQQTYALTVVTDVNMALMSALCICHAYMVR
ncbi:tubby C-terminal-like domain-containing protein [Stachybotrys elegans]|uniref:Tubby C-terminal-like domain-containing protein n=1 Tax=Stachybotrys elegans TaxID=80388 RepID=A0A8K0WKR6_9HYPO|nr:tubby C-terminal-like domain-containing protein [Stachybotrys elegans]